MIVFSSRLLCITLIYFTIRNLWPIMPTDLLNKTCKKKVLNRKSEHHHLILYSNVSAQTVNFDFLDQICPPKRYFWSNIGKMNTIIESCISNKYRYQISTQTDNFNFLDKIYPKKVFLVENRKSEHHQ